MADRVLSDNAREWLYFPIEMPVTEYGEGPAKIGVDAYRMTYEVWDITCESYGSFDCLPDAINHAIRMNREDPANLYPYVDEVRNAQQ